MELTPFPKYQIVDERLFIEAARGGRGGHDGHHPRGAALLSGSSSPRSPSSRLVKGAACPTALNLLARKRAPSPSPEHLPRPRDSLLQRICARVRSWTIGCDVRHHHYPPEALLQVHIHLLFLSAATVREGTNDPMEEVHQGRSSARFLVWILAAR